MRTPKNPLRRVPRQPPEEHLGAAPPQVRRTLGLRQGAISNENAALAGRRARFQGIGFFKASGGKVGGRKHTVSATNLREFGHRSRRDPPEASMFVLRRRGFSTRKLSSDPCDTTHPTTQPTQPQPRQPESEQKRRKTTQGAYGAMRAVNRQPWNPQRRGWAQVRTPKNPLSRVPRQPPEEHLGAPPVQVRRKLRLRQGAISNGNAALAGRRARFQGIGFFKASGGKVGGAQAHSECNKSTGIWA